MTRGPLPSAAVLRAMFRYDPATGILFWRRRRDRPRAWNTRFAGTEAGCVHLGSRLIGVSGLGNVRAHRLIWKLVHDTEPDVVDHIDGDPLNNRLTNLRAATWAQNSWNRRRNSRRRGKPRGVHRYGNRWVALIGVNGRRIRIGRFDTAAEAYAAYVQAARHHHGEFARFD